MPESPVARIIERSVQLNEARARRLRLAFLRSETMGTLMLGCVSLTLAIVLTLATLLGFAGIPTGSLSKQGSLWIEVPRSDGSPNRVEIREPYSMEVRYYVVQKLWIPSDDCVSLAIVGFVCGLLGVLLSLRRKRFSWLSSIGLAIIVIMELAIIGFNLIMDVGS